MPKIDLIMRSLWYSELRFYWGVDCPEAVTLLVIPYSRKLFTYLSLRENCVSGTK